MLLCYNFYDKFNKKALDDISIDQWYTLVIAWFGAIE